MSHNAIETIMGAGVLVVAALFMGFAYSGSNLRNVQGYQIAATFPMVDGIKVGTDVRVNGVKVGSVTGMNLITASGQDQYMVKLTMSILPDVQLPTDTMALAASESLLGGKYVSLEIGVEDDIIAADGNGRITRTQAPMRIDDLIGRLIYSSSSGKDQNKDAPDTSNHLNKSTRVSSPPDTKDDNIP